MPEDRQISVYSLEEIAIEKAVALADAARTEARDLYDLWYLTTEAGVELSHLLGGIRDKLAFRRNASKGFRWLSLQRKLDSEHNGGLASRSK